MTAVGETFRKIAVIGDLKIITIQTDADCDDNFTIDLNSDVTDGKGQAMKTVLFSYLQDDQGTNVDDLAFDPATGILTIPNITTGIHNITIIGI